MAAQPKRRVSVSVWSSDRSPGNSNRHTPSSVAAADSGPSGLSSFAVTTQPAERPCPGGRPKVRRPANAVLGSAALARTEAGGPGLGGGREVGTVFGQWLAGRARRLAEDAGRAHGHHEQAVERLVAGLDGSHQRAEWWKLVHEG